MIDACERCLRRSYLIAHLSPGIAGLLGHVRRDAPPLLSLAEDELIEAVAGRRPAAARAFVDRFDPAGARLRLTEAGTGAACCHGGRYPEALRQLHDPPAVLFSAGDPAWLAELLLEPAVPAVTVVGSRRASAHGLEVAYELGRGLGAAGVCVISGLAMGIDAAAHRGALDGGGAALAVVAGGTDVVYPRVNRGLHRRVLGAGAVVSEHPPGQRCLRWSFPARNRLMAALGRVTVVVEAAARSGSLITAELASDLGRVVAAVPDRVTAAGAAGGNLLLRDGACVILGAQDVLDELFGVGSRPAGPGEEAQRLPSLERFERMVLEGVERVGGGAGTLGREVGLPASIVRGALARLELMGLVARDPLGLYERRAG